MPTLRTSAFLKWFDGLRDVTTQARIEARIIRLEAGNPGDVKPIGKGVRELRFSFGPGYRVYFIANDRDIVLLLGGDKASQDRDIAAALAMLED